MEDKKERSALLQKGSLHLKAFFFFHFTPIFPADFEGVVSQITRSPYRIHGTHVSLRGTSRRPPLILLPSLDSGFRSRILNRHLTLPNCEISLRLHSRIPCRTPSVSDECLSPVGFEKRDKTSRSPYVNNTSAAHHHPWVRFFLNLCKVLVLRHLFSPSSATSFCSRQSLVCMWGMLWLSHFDLT